MFSENGEAKQFAARTFAIKFAGQHFAIHPRCIQNKWQPIVAFAKPPLNGAGAVRRRSLLRWRSDPGGLKGVGQEMAGDGACAVSGSRLSRDTRTHASESRFESGE